MGDGPGGLRIRIGVATTLCVCAWFGACAAEPVLDPYAPRPVREVDKYVVWSDDDRVIGQVVLLEIDDLAEPVRIYRAENTSRQWLGYVDLWGRVFRRLPFEESETFVGMYSMEKGLAVLYEEDRPVRVARAAADRNAPGAGTASEAAVDRDR